MVLHYYTDVQVAVKCQDMQQYANKDREKEDCKLVNQDENNAGFKKTTLQMEGNPFNMFVRAQGYSQCVLVSKTECKHNFCLCTIKQTWQHGRQ